MRIGFTYTEIRMLSDEEVNVALAVHLGNEQRMQDEQEAIQRRMS